jgi:hypothetical protein
VFNEVKKLVLRAGSSFTPTGKESHAASNIETNAGRLFALKDAYDSIIV